MSNTENSRSCPACQNNFTEFIGKKNDYLLMRCKKCSTLLTDRLPSFEEARNYNEYYTSSNLTVPSFIFERLREILLPLEKHRQNDRLLDVGFGAGTLLAAAIENGWDAYGVEVSRPAYEQARGRGYQVSLGYLSEVGYPDNYFDVITASEIIEHLSDPVEDL